MIKFQTIRWKNLLSTGNAWTAVRLDEHPNTLIIGANGSGKSTLLDALCFGLFGKPFRNINKPNLLNSINQRDGVVEIEFMIGKKQYKVVRGIKPNIFEVYCAGVMVDQDSKSKDYQDHLEKFILKLNFKSFTQVVILGSASFVPFMQLKPADRRAIIEDLLDIQIFSAMNELVKKRVTGIASDQVQTKYNEDLVANRIDMQKQHIEEFKKHNDAEIEKKRQEIELGISQVKKLVSDVAGIQGHIDILQKKISHKAALEDKSRRLLQLESKLETNIKKAEKDIAFYELNDNCPTCLQGLDMLFKTKQIANRKQRKEEISTGMKGIEEQIQNLNVQFGEIHSVLTHITQHNNEIVKHNSTISAINNYMVKVTKEIQELNDRKENLGDMDKKLADLNSELDLLKAKQEELSVQKHYYTFASTLLKDTGIKTQIIKQYLPIMNKLINKYLAAMDFFVNFNISESFEETIKSRFRDEFTYANFSEGEKMRIDLALLMAWRQIAKLKNSTNTNLLILDEVFDGSLDATGTDEFMKLIYDMGVDTNVFVISHKGDILFDKFKNVIRFQKRNNFSEVVK